MTNNGLSYELRARTALEANGFKCNHSLGQNFILDGNFLSFLLDISEIKANENVLEIGPGPGLMTALVSERAKNIYSIELDKNLEPVLSSTLEGVSNCEVIFADALKTDLSELVKDKMGGNYRVIANLPYYITADLILKMLQTDPTPESLCLMVQKEAAERFMSRPGMKNWCALAAVVQYFGKCEILADVPADMFSPPPHVESCFIRISVNESRVFSGKEEKDFLRLIRCSFAMRRKTLANNLKAGYGFQQSECQSLIREAGLPEQIRGEALNLDEMSNLFKIIQMHKQSKQSKG